MSQNEDLVQSIQTGLVDISIPSIQHLRPELLSNNYKQGRKVLTSIIRELRECDEFWISVAFITTSGVATLINTLNELNEKGVGGRILASQYLYFTQPEALSRLKQLSNIELRMATEGAFHSKGYMFKKSYIYNLIIGSSNLTENALSKNKEWNLKVSGAYGSELIKNVINEFKVEFNSAQIVTDQFLTDYREIWGRKQEFDFRVEEEAAIYEPKVKPNKMQTEALLNLEKLRLYGERKALLVSATGTGKTYLSAFDVLKVKPKRFLFLVHRLNIAEKAMKTFQSLIGRDYTYGIFSGGSRDLESDYIFSTIQTISRPHNLSLFQKDYFDYIVIDESHRAAADSYSAILNHFNPNFLLGMTATPERTDGADIYKIFNYNIAYEIRLNQALAEDMLSSFHYYGVTDLTINNEPVNDTTDFNKLTASERVNRICEVAKFYGCDNGVVRGLVFCSKNEIASILSDEFNSRGYRTIALSGSSSESERKEAIEKLEKEENELDYIFSVDIFNEGIDIPRVNQIIMLRPTQSAIIFVQQLGRGLRKAKRKEYLTVIDFIGNYKNNFLIPIALYGDTSYNKDSLRKLLTTESSWIPGSSTINFDKITKDRIFDSISNANLLTKKELTHDYKILKMKLGRIPMMVDYLKYGSRDPWSYVKKFKSYYNFIAEIEPDIYYLDLHQIELLNLISNEINNSKRVEESLLLEILANQESVSVDQFINRVESIFGYKIDQETIESILNNINFTFIRKDFELVKFGYEEFSCGEDLEIIKGNKHAFEYLLDNIKYSILEFKKKFHLDKFNNGFLIGEKYSRKDVCRILNWPKDISSTLYGYRTNNGITPCFVTYNKSDHISEGTKYKDEFIDPQTFAWESRSGRKVESTEVQNVVKSKRIELFVKKGDGEGSDFYYMGDVGIIPGSVEQSYMNDGKPVVSFKFKLSHPVETGLYNYLID